MNIANRVHVECSGLGWFLTELQFCKLWQIISKKLPTFRSKTACLISVCVTNFLLLQVFQQLHWNIHNWPDYQSTAHSLDCISTKQVRRAECFVLKCSALHYAALQCTAMHSILHCIELHYTALYCTVLHCIALYCISLHCIILNNWPRKDGQEDYKWHVLHASLEPLFC